MPWVAAAIGGSALLSGGLNLFGSSKASDAATQAAKMQQAQYQQNAATLAPFIQGGASVMPALNALATGSPYGGGPNYVQQASGMLPGTETQAQLAATPGYQFTMQQGQEQVAAQNAARGLGVSGAQLKGAANFATGLASQTYQNIFNQQQQQFGDVLGLNTAQQANLQNQYGRLAGVAGIGEGAGQALAGYGTSAAATAGGLTNQAGQAQAAGLVNIGNAASQGINNYLGYQNYQTQMQNQQANAAAQQANAANIAQIMSGQTGNYPANQLAYNAMMNPTSQNAYGPGF